MKQWLNRSLLYCLTCFYWFSAPLSLLIFSICSPSCQGSWASAWVQVLSWKSGLCKVMSGFKATFLTLLFPWGALLSPVQACPIQLTVPVTLKMLFLKSRKQQDVIGKVEKAVKGQSNVALILSWHCCWAALRRKMVFHRLGKVGSLPRVCLL